MNSHDLLSVAKQLWVTFGPSPFGIATDLWTLLCLYWIVSALQQKGASKREGWFDRLRHTSMVGFGIFLIFSHHAHFTWLGKRFVPEWLWIAVGGVVLTAGGVGLADEPPCPGGGGFLCKGSQGRKLVEPRIWREL